MSLGDLPAVLGLGHATEFELHIPAMHPGLDVLALVNHGLESAVKLGYPSAQRLLMVPHGARQIPRVCQNVFECVDDSAHEGAGREDRCVLAPLLQGPCFVRKLPPTSAVPDQFTRLLSRPGPEVESAFAAADAPRQKSSLDRLCLGCSAPTFRQSLIGEAIRVLPELRIDDDPEVITSFDVICFLLPGSCVSSGVGDYVLPTVSEKDAAVPWLTDQPGNGGALPHGYVLVGSPPLSTRIDACPRWFNALIVEPGCDLRNTHPIAVLLIDQPDDGCLGFVHSPSLRCWGVRKAEGCGS